MSSKKGKGAGKDFDAGLKAEEEYNSEELEEEEIDDELNLPKTLQHLSYEEKKDLLRFKNEHNEREWEEEISRRGAAFERKLDYERLKRMTTTGTSSKETKQQASLKVVGKAKKSVEIESGSEEEESDDNAGREEDDGNDEEEDELVADEKDEFNQDTEDENEDEDDDLFNSDEEAEISKRPTKQATEDGELSDESAEDDFQEISRKPSKVLGKRKSRGRTASNTRRSSRLTSKYSVSSDDEDADDAFVDAEEEEDEEDEDVDRRVSYGDGDDDQHDYNLKSIKDSHRRVSNRDGITSSSSNALSQSEKSSLMFENLSQLKAHLEKQLQKELPIKPDDHELAEAADFRKLFRRRDDIVHNLHEPFFDQLMIGCYIRYLIGIVDNIQVYRMCEIIGIDRSKKVYRLPPLSNGTIVETSVRLHLNNAGEIKQYQKLDKVSNHSLQEKEIEFHIQGMQGHPEKILPTKRDFRKLRQRHKQFAEHTYTHEDISHMVSSKLGLNKLITTEYSTAMTLLKKRLDEAVQKNDKEKSELLRKEIRKLDDITEKQKQIFEANAKKQSDINRRMRESNVTRDMDAGMRKRHEEMEALAKGILPNAISDPFIRRETRPKILWNTSEALKKKKEEAKEQKDVKAVESINNDKKPTNKKQRVQEDDRWATSIQLNLSEVRKRVKLRLGVDPYEALHVSKRDKYLKKVCAGLPPIGSEERERLRGKNKSLKDYILLLSKNDEEYPTSNPTE